MNMMAIHTEKEDKEHKGDPKGSPQTVEKVVLPQAGN